MEETLTLELEQEQAPMEIEIGDELPNLNRFKDIKGNPRDNQALAQELDLTKTNAVAESKAWVISQEYRNQEQVEDTISNKTYDKETIDNKLSEVEGKIPTKVSDLQNDSEFTTKSYVDGGLNNKVDKVEGKGLSTNDFTNAEKTKLAGLENYDDTEIKDDISALEDRVDTAESDIDTIESKIPSQASDENQLADKNFVNSSIATQTAYFQGTFDVVNDLGLTLQATHLQVETALETIIGVKTNNDYVFVSFFDTSISEVLKYERYKFTSDDNSWNFEYELNNSTFTAVQWEAINSGISSLLVAQITNNQNAITQINTSLTELATRVGNNETAISNIQSAITTLQSELTTLAGEVIKGVKVNNTELTKGSDGKVNIPTTTTSRLGVIMLGQYGSEVDGANGRIRPTLVNYETYKSQVDKYFISKGTLESVLDNETPRIDKSQTLTDTQKTQVLSNIGGQSVLPPTSLGLLNAEPSRVVLSINEQYNPNIIGTPSSVSSADNTIATATLSSGVITIKGIAVGHTTITINKSDSTSIQVGVVVRGA